MSISYYKLKLFTGILSIILVLCASIASGQAMKNTEENNFHNSIGNGSERIFSSEINNYLSQNINISAEKTSLARVLKYITAKTGVDFSYSSDVIPYKILVSISAHDITVLAALDQIFHDTNIEWLPRNNRQIVLRINDDKNRDIDNTGTLRGSVSDSTNGEALAFGNVILKEIKRGASTDGHGNFRIPGVPGNRTYTLMVSYIGYKTKEISVYVSVGKITDVNIELSPVAVEMRAVEKVGERIIEKNATDIGLQRISIKDLETMPKGVESDVFRTIQYLPGVQSTGDVSARYYVRGSASNENLVLLNGVTLYNPFHALGIFSVIDPDMINNVEFYKGGFTAEYGGRLSSVLNVITKDGNKKNFGASATSSFLTGKGMVEG
ncbi:MAG: TonB-dependent receptor, partial [Ignavibacteriaceae bacterium]